MKKRKFSILLNISALCLCLAAVSIGVYSVKTAQLNITGTIGFQAHNCDVMINGIIENGSRYDSTTKQLTPTTLYYNTTGAAESTPTYKNVHNDTTGWQIGDLYFDDLNDVPEDKIAKDIVITLSIYNDSDFEVYGVFDASKLGFISSQVEVKAQKGSETASEKVYIKMSAKQTSTNATTLTITFTLKSEDFTQLELTTKALVEFTKERPADMPVEMPAKGQLITMNLGGDYATGLQNTYRVLKTEGNTALVMAMFDAKTLVGYDDSAILPPVDEDPSSIIYKDSTLDTYLNTTWYNTLDETKRTTIVASDITQYSYDSEAKFSSKAAVETITGRKIYALDFEDIEEYFGGAAGSATYETANDAFSREDLSMFFWNTETIPSTAKNIWFRSGFATNEYIAWYMDILNGRIVSGPAANSAAARPAFKIDLSSIDWSSYQG